MSDLDRVWYIPDRDHQKATGPFTKAEIIAKIGTGELRVDDYVWAQHLAGARWQRISDIDELYQALANYPKIPVPLPMDIPAPPPPDAVSQESVTPQSKFKEEREVTRTTSEIYRKRKVPSMDQHSLRFESEGYYGLNNLYRRFPRAPFEGEVVIHDGHVYRRAKSVDISEKGIMVDLNDLQAFPKGQEVTVTIKGSPELGTFSVSGVIVRLITEADLKGYGVYFLRVSPHIRRMIARYVLRTLGASGFTLREEAKRSA